MNPLSPRRQLGLSTTLNSSSPPPPPTVSSFIAPSSSHKLLVLPFYHQYLRPMQALMSPHRYKPSLCPQGRNSKIRKASPTSLLLWKDELQLKNELKSAKVILEGSTLTRLCPYLELWISRKLCSKTIPQVRFIAYFADRNTGSDD